MKILVDELPKTPSECIFYTDNNSDRMKECILKKDKLVVDKCYCNESTKNCPFLREFKAVSKETIRQVGNSRTVRSVPVELEEE